MHRTEHKRLAGAGYHLRLRRSPLDNPPDSRQLALDGLPQAFAGGPTFALTSKIANGFTRIAISAERIAVAHSAERVRPSRSFFRSTAFILPRLGQLRLLGRQG